MAKELPYFKFEPAEYLTKDVSFCSFEVQGYFISLCCYYWQRNCKLSKQQIIKRLGGENLFNELVDDGIIDVKNDNITIKFLENQLLEVSKKSDTNSLNGSKGGRPKKRKETETKAKQNPNESETISETKGIREDKIRLDKIKEDEIKKDDEFAFAKSPTIFDRSVNITVEKWLENYIQDDRTTNAVIRNPKNKLPDIADLKSKAAKFVDHINEQGKKGDTYSGFCGHFREWAKYQNKEYQSNFRFKDHPAARNNPII